ncbi:recombinase family protein [Sporosarcina sp. HYO08]|uniref:recombinase family protein n=1 Tax=Sporosarcina sp. HYO08 TaxID=1759557 RepID=UPI00079C9ABA|nr:recombinase family protein [Sporosarcina sp. HYO08]KXH81829.1 hypothetical protein AU377_06075 [Sporosarcina sp. HYO08]
MKFGYQRPILEDQKMTQQLAHIEIDEMFSETHGFAKKRHELENLLMKVESGDEIVVQNIEVLADSLHHFLDLLRLAERDGVTIHFIDEELTNRTIQEGNLSTWTQFFTSLQSTFISHASTFGIQAAIKQGKTIGRPRKSDVNLEKAFEMYKSKQYTLHDIKNETGISKSTLYRYLDSKV